MRGRGELSVDKCVDLLSAPMVQIMAKYGTIRTLFCLRLWHFWSKDLEIKQKRPPLRELLESNLNDVVAQIDASWLEDFIAGHDVEEHIIMGGIRDGCFKEYEGYTKRRSFEQILEDLEALHRREITYPKPLPKWALVINEAMNLPLRVLYFFLSGGRLKYLHSDPSLFKKRLDRFHENCINRTIIGFAFEYHSSKELVGLRLELNECLKHMPSVSPAKSPPSPKSSTSKATSPRRLSAREIVSDIRKGKNRRELMGKYGISSQALDRLIGQLVEKQLLSDSEAASARLSGR